MKLPGLIAIQLTKNVTRFALNVISEVNSTHLFVVLKHNLTLFNLSSVSNIEACI